MELKLASTILKHICIIFNLHPGIRACSQEDSDFSFLHLSVNCEQDFNSALRYSLKLYSEMICLMFKSMLDIRGYVGEIYS